VSISDLHDQKMLTRGHSEGTQLCQSHSLAASGGDLVPAVVTWWVNVGWEEHEPPSDRKDVDWEGLSTGPMGSTSSSFASGDAMGGRWRSLASIPADRGSLPLALARTSRSGAAPRAANADPASLLPFARVGSLGFGLHIVIVVCVITVVQSQQGEGWPGWLVAGFSTMSGWIGEVHRICMCSALSPPSSLS